MLKLTKYQSLKFVSTYSIVKYQLNLYEELIIEKDDIQYNFLAKYVDKKYIIENYYMNNKVIIFDKQYSNIFDVKQELDKLVNLRFANNILFTSVCDKILLTLAIDNSKLNIVLNKINMNININDFETNTMYDAFQNIDENTEIDIDDVMNDFRGNNTTKDTKPIELMKLNIKNKIQQINILAQEQQKIINHCIDEMYNKNIINILHDFLELKEDVNTTAEKVTNNLQFEFYPQHNGIALFKTLVSEEQFNKTGVFIELTDGLLGINENFQDDFFDNSRITVINQQNQHFLIDYINGKINGRYSDLGKNINVFERFYKNNILQGCVVYSEINIAEIEENIIEINETTPQHIFAIEQISIGNYYFIISAITKKCIIFDINYLNNVCIVKNSDMFLFDLFGETELENLFVTVYDFVNQNKVLLTEYFSKAIVITNYDKKTKNYILDTILQVLINKINSHVKNQTSLDGVDINFSIFLNSTLAVLLNESVRYNYITELLNLYKSIAIKRNSTLLNNNLHLNYFINQYFKDIVERLPNLKGIGSNIDKKYVINYLVDIRYSHLVSIIVPKDPTKKTLIFDSSNYLGDFAKPPFKENRYGKQLLNETYYDTSVIINENYQVNGTCWLFGILSTLYFSSLPEATILEWIDTYTDHVNLNQIPMKTLKEISETIIFGIYNQLQDILSINYIVMENSMLEKYTDYTKLFVLDKMETKINEVVSSLEDRKLRHCLAEQNTRENIVNSD